ncbi:MAG: DUF2279 domain-containing protein [Chitinophagales bacterium]|jgi:hypothetical protein|nr:DUF2279 domain-containing protein [Sphingobacteriales bacterium]MBP7534290.1 DUF2279 domain-containing protein [Chitinophagales bacterium]
MILDKKYFSRHFLGVCLLVYLLIGTTMGRVLAQSVTTDSTQRIPFLRYANMPNKGRIIGVSAVGGVGYTAGMAAVSRLWYAQYPQTSFHFFNDNSGWLQIDKVGHAWTAYSEALLAARLYRWAGVKSNTSAWIGFGLGNLFQGGIEVLDGYSVGWGASTGDLIANVSGTSLMLGQELWWKEQRIAFKYSSRKPVYSNYPLAVQERALDLYGNSLGERLLKDYNGQSYWLSANVSSFMRRRPAGFPQWLNVAVGYGAEGMLGAERNTWQNPSDSTQMLNYSYIPRVRQYYLSLDVDFTRIPTRSRWLKMLFLGLNTLKIPSPTLEYNNRDKFVFHPVYW